MHFQGKERQLHYRWFEGEAITGGKGRRPPFITMEGGNHAGLDWLGAGAIHFYFAQKESHCNLNTRARGRANTGLPGY